MSPFILGLVCGLIAMFGWGLGEATAKLAVKKVGEFTSYFWVQLIIWVVFAFAAIFSWENFANLNLTVVMFSLIIGATYTFAYIFAYKAYNVGKLAIVSPILCSYGMLSAVLAAIFLNQSLTPVQFVAIGLILMGTVFMSVEFDNNGGGDKLKVTAGLFEALLAFLFFGINSVFLDYISEKADINTLNFLNATFSMLLISGYFLISKTKVGNVNKASLWPVILTAIFTMLANYFFLLGYTVGDSIILGPLGGASGVVTALVSVFVFKERITFVQATSIAVVFAGIVILAL